jgi:hypothetical protein
MNVVQEGTRQYPTRYVDVPAQTSSEEITKALLAFVEPLTADLKQHKWHTIELQSHSTQGPLYSRTSYTTAADVAAARLIELINGHPNESRVPPFAFYAANAEYVRITVIEV